MAINSVLDGTTDIGGSISSLVLIFGVIALAVHFMRHAFLSTEELTYNMFYKNK